jgi:hypothetical protein
MKEHGISEEGLSVKAFISPEETEKTYLLPLGFVSR